MSAVIYRRRENALSRGEREWRVEEGGLVSVGASGHERRWAWKDFLSVRLCHEPTRLKPWRYTFEAQFKNGQKVAIDNGHYLGPGRFEERSESYAPFVRELVTRLHEANPKLRALIGETQKRYFFLMLASLIGLGLLAWVLVAAPTPLDAVPGSGIIKFLIIVAMLPVFFRYVLRALPRGVALDCVPERALPPGGSNSSDS